MAQIKSRKHPIARRLNCSAAVAMAFMAIPGVVFAQQADTTLPEVKVTGQTETYKAEKPSSPKFTQPLVDTPQTITVIKKELLQDQGATTLTEALRNTPGITMTMGENGNTTTGDSIFMRGFDTQGSIFVDGIRDLGTITRDVFNFEQIEIVKGPSGSDNGRGAPSGYINLESKKAKAGDASSAIVGVRSSGAIRATADVNKQFSEDAAFRLNFLSDTGAVEDRDWVKNKSLGIAPSVTFGLNTPTRVTLNFLHIEQRNRPDGGIPAIGIPGYQPVNAQVAANNVAVNRSNYYGSANDFNDVDANMFTAFIEHDLAPNVTLRNTTRYGVTEQNYNLTGINALTTTGAPSTWTVSRSRQGKDQQNEILTNQTNVTADLQTGAIKHSVSTGVEFIREKQVNKTMAAAAGTQTVANLYNPNVGDAFLPLIYSGASTDGTTTTAAVYAFDTIKLNEQFLINGGIRYEHYKTEYTSIATTGVGTRFDKSDDLVTWKLGAVYKPAENGSVYVAYASSQKPPGSDNFSLATGNNVNNPNIEPQKATNIEIGSKWDVLDNRLALTGAIFQTENKNAAVQTDPITNQPTAFGNQRVKGVELGMVGQVTPAWQISTGLARMDTETVVGTANQTGANLNWSPKLTFTGWTTYKLPLGWTIGGGMRYVDSQVRSANAVQAATNVAQLPSYTVYDAMASYEINKNLSLQLNIYNLADKFYVQSLNSGGGRFVLGQPRSAFLAANLKF